jgi:hypothetical protein
MEGPTETKMICMIVYIDTEYIVVKAILYCYLTRYVLEAHLVPTMARR